MLKRAYDDCTVLTTTYQGFLCHHVVKTKDQEAPGGLSSQRNGVDSTLECINAMQLKTLDNQGQTGPPSISFLMHPL